MDNFEERDYRIFELFHKQTAIVSAGTPEHFNGCTIGWGSLGTLWTLPGKSGASLTVYVHPGRYTLEFLKSNPTFTVSFFPKEYRRALGYMGTRSGRNENKAVNAGLTPVAVGDSVGYREASLTFYCRKIYQHLMAKEDIAPDIQEYYRNDPKVYPVDEKGDWQPHWIIIGEILNVTEKL